MNEGPKLGLIDAQARPSNKGVPSQEGRQARKKTFTVIQAKSKAENWRDDFLYDLAAAKAEKLGTSVEIEIKKTRDIEGLRRSARNIKRIRGKLIKSSTTMCHVTEDGVRREVTEKEDLEQVAANENDSRFSQSENTPPMTNPLV